MDVQTAMKIWSTENGQAQFQAVIADFLSSITSQFTEDFVIQIKQRRDAGTSGLVQQWNWISFTEATFAEREKEAISLMLKELMKSRISSSRVLFVQKDLKSVGRGTLTIQFVLRNDKNAQSMRF